VFGTMWIVAISLWFCFYDYYKYSGRTIFCIIFFFVAYSLWGVYDKYGSFLTLDIIAVYTIIGVVVPMLLVCTCLCLCKCKNKMFGYCC
jgi:hypothetical protein